jgi:hypothetical protein
LTPCLPSPLSPAGRALLFLLPEELGFLKYLRAAKVAMNEYEFPDKKVAQVQVRWGYGCLHSYCCCGVLTLLKLLPRLWAAIVQAARMRHFPRCAAVCRPAGCGFLLLTSL